MASVSSPARRPRGAIDVLPSGALRVRVHAGIDPLTKQRRTLVEVIPPSPTARREAEKARTRLLNEVDERRHSRVRATVNQLMDRYLELLNVSATTRVGYQRAADKHIRPLLGEMRLEHLNAETLDEFYARLAVCREHCGGRRYVEHRKSGDHECADKCRPHVCRPLAASSIREVHWIISGALKRAKRWKWIAVNVAEQAEPPAQPAPKPKPPTPEEAARIVAEAWRDPEWGMLIWLAMTTGARRGELCALRWSDINLDQGVLGIERAIVKVSGELIEQDTKTHQQRRVALDPDTVELLRGHRERWRGRLGLLGLELDGACRVFSLVPDAGRPLDPGSTTQRYSKLARRLGIETSLKALRHYSATELIAGGVDVRTVAGRLGHGSGGVTTLRVYAAFRSEADQRASLAVTARMPKPPTAGAEVATTPTNEPMAAVGAGAAAKPQGQSPTAERPKRRSPANSRSLVARAFWDAEAAAGRTPSGSEIARTAGVDPSLGRRWRREWLSSSTDPAAAAQVS